MEMLKFAGMCATIFTFLSYFFYHLMLSKFYSKDNIKEIMKEVEEDYLSKIKSTKDITVLELKDNINNGERKMIEKFDEKITRSLEKLEHEMKELKELILNRIING